jgi:hypothetical protein
MLGVTLLWQSMHVEGEVDCAFRRVEDTRMQSKSNSGLALILPLSVLSALQLPGQRFSDDYWGFCILPLVFSSGIWLLPA